MNLTNGPPSTWDGVKHAYRNGRRPSSYPHPDAPHPSVYDDFDAAMAAGSLLRANGADRLARPAHLERRARLQRRRPDRRGLRRRRHGARGSVGAQFAARDRRRSRVRSWRDGLAGPRTGQLAVLRRPIVGGLPPRHRHRRPQRHIDPRRGCGPRLGRAGHRRRRAATATSPASRTRRRSAPATPTRSACSCTSARSSDAASRSASLTAPAAATDRTCTSRSASTAASSAQPATSAFRRARCAWRGHPAREANGRQPGRARDPRARDHGLRGSVRARGDAFRSGDPDRGGPHAGGHQPTRSCSRTGPARGRDGTALSPGRGQRRSPSGGSTGTGDPWPPSSARSHDSARGDLRAQLRASATQARGDASLETRQARQSRHGRSDQPPRPRRAGGRDRRHSRADVHRRSRRPRRSALPRLRRPTRRRARGVGGERVGAAAMTARIPLHAARRSRAVECGLAFDDLGGPLVAVCGLVGGAGTSTLALLLARQAAAESSAPVLLTEADAQRPGLAALTGHATPHSLEALASQRSDDHIPTETFAELEPGLRLVAATPRQRAPAQPDALNALLGEARDAHGLVVVDCGTNWSATSPVHERATHVIWTLPATPVGLASALLLLDERRPPAARTSARDRRSDGTRARVPAPASARCGDSQRGAPSASCSFLTAPRWPGARRTSTSRSSARSLVWHRRCGSCDERRFSGHRARQGRHRRRLATLRRRSHRCWWR